MVNGRTLSPEEIKVLKALKLAEVYLRLRNVDPRAWRTWRRDFDSALKLALHDDNQDFTVAVMTVIHLFAGRYPDAPQIAWDAMWAFDVIVETVRGPLQFWISEGEPIPDLDLNDETCNMLAREGYRKAWGVELACPGPDRVASIVRAIMPVTLWRGNTSGRAILIADQGSS